MKKQERRAKIFLVLAAVLFMGILVFTWRFITKGGEWAGFYGNTQIYTNGVLNRGTIYDRNGTLLLRCTPDGPIYPDDRELRVSTLHVVGDPKGNIATGAINMHKSELIGYDLLNGTYDTKKDGKKITLTIDGTANKVAYDALGGYDGCVGVFNYKTGEILALVNKPSFDPEEGAPSDPNSPVYFNTFISGTMTPGSTFKTVTSYAAIETVDDIDNFSYTCKGSDEINGTKITCAYAHGTVDFDGALAQSCNCAFGHITQAVGAENMKRYVKKAGLTKSLDIDGVKTAKGSFDFSSTDDGSLAWAGIGQGSDLVNPCTMMVYMGAIANKGEAVRPSLLKSSNIIKKLRGGESLGEYLDADTADKLKDMMKNNVSANYGTSSFPGLDIGAKSGTAEVGSGSTNAWFVGFLDDPDHPYAFVVWVKGGGNGAGVAGPVANKALQALMV